MPTDTERLDWLQNNGAGCGVVEDDNGHWAYLSDGCQNVPDSDAPTDIWTSFFVDEAKWYPTLRAAIDAAMSSSDEGGQ